MALKDILESLAALDPNYDPSLEKFRKEEIEKSKQGRRTFQELYDLPTKEQAKLEAEGNRKKMEESKKAYEQEISPEFIGPRQETPPQPPKEEDFPNKMEEARRKFIEQTGYSPEMTPLEASQMGMAELRIAQKEASKNRLAGGSLTPESLRYSIDYFNATGTMPDFLRGFGMAQARTQFANALSSQSGSIDPRQAAVRQAAFKANTAELTKIQTLRGPLAAFEKQVEFNSNLILQSLNEINPTKLPLLNDLYLKGETRVLGDPASTNYLLRLRTLANEYARLTTTATAGSITTDTARKEIDDVIPKIATVEQMRSLINETVLPESRKRIDNFRTQEEEVKNSIMQLGENNLPPSSSPTPTNPPVSAKTTYGNPNQVKMAVAQGKLTKDQAREILRAQFGYK